MSFSNFCPQPKWHSATKEHWEVLHNFEYPLLTSVLGFVEGFFTCSSAVEPSTEGLLKSNVSLPLIKLCNIGCRSPCWRLNPFFLRPNLCIINCRRSPWWRLNLLFIVQSLAYSVAKVSANRQPNIFETSSSLRFLMILIYLMAHTLIIILRKFSILSHHQKKVQHFHRNFLMKSTLIYCKLSK